MSVTLNLFQGLITGKVLTFKLGFLHLATYLMKYCRGQLASDEALPCRYEVAKKLKHKTGRHLLFCRGIALQIEIVNLLD